MVWKMDTGIYMTLSGNQNFVLSPFQISNFFSFEYSHDQLHKLIDARSLDMSSTPYHRSTGKQKRDAIIAVYLRFAFH